MDTSTTTTRFVQPEVVSSHFHIQPGSVVADLGAGSGFFIPSLAHAVGDNGLVYACEIQKSLVEKISEMGRTQYGDTIRALWCDIDEKDGLPLEDNSVDVAVLINTLFLLEKKDDAAQEISRIVRPGGRLYVVDWKEPFDGLGPRQDMLITETEASDLFETHHFTLESHYPAGAHHYGLSFRNT